MQSPGKPLIVALVASLTFAFGAAPSHAATHEQDFSLDAVAAAPNSQTIEAQVTTVSDRSLDAIARVNNPENTPHGFDVEKAIQAAESEIGTSRATGWSAPGECIESAKRWVTAGGAAWVGAGDPVSNYNGAARLTIAEAQPGDVVQYENVAFPTSWVTGVHTVLITGVNDDGTFTIVESNNPTGSGLVQQDTNWLPTPPAGFQAVVWRF